MAVDRLKCSCPLGRAFALQRHVNASVIAVFHKSVNSSLRKTAVYSACCALNEKSSVVLNRFRERGQDWKTRGGRRGGDGQGMRERGVKEER